MIVFNSNEIKRQSIFLHKIEHIVNIIPPDLRDHGYLSTIYSEFCADKFLFDINPKVFKKGRVEDYINNYLKVEEMNKEIIDNILRIFIFKVGKLSYFNSAL